MAPNLRKLTIAANIFAIIVVGVATQSLDCSCYDPSDIIERDVCIIGGGSSGTYATIRIRDFNLSTVVVEKAPNLGGHTNTYRDPATGKYQDYGVLGYTNNSIVRSYFQRLGVQYQNLSYSSLWPATASHEVDLKTGEINTPNLTADTAAAWSAYSKQLDKYPYLETGFELPDPVPTDLLLSFDEFTRKYNLQDLVRSAYSYGQGYGNILAQTSLYILKLLDKVFLETLAEGPIAAADGNNLALYENATKELGQDALVNSSILAMDRSNATNIKILVQTEAGRKLIVAKTLVVSIPPKLDNLNGFDLTEDEQSIFTQFNNSGYYTALLNNTGIEDNLSIDNYAVNAPYGIPSMPAIYGIPPTNFPGIHNIFYGSLANYTDEQVKADMIATLQRLSDAARTTSSSTNTTNCDPHFVEFRSHAPFGLSVSVDAIANGFYRNMSALQGQQSTWWTGAAWHTQDSSQLWNWTEVNIVPRVVQSLAS